MTSDLRHLSDLDRLRIRVKNSFQGVSRVCLVFKDRALQVIRCMLVALAALMVASAARAQQTAPGGTAGLPTEYRLNLMIRTTIIALNQANETGNYSVLRDLAAPSFQQANSAARLAEAFANMRNRNIDLAPALFFEPKLVRPPTIQPNGKLRLSGYFETKPEQVNFDLAFEWVESAWRLFGIAVELSLPKPSANAATGSASPGDTASGGTAAKSESPRPDQTGAPKKKDAPARNK